MCFFVLQLVTLNKKYALLQGDVITTKVLSVYEHFLNASPEQLTSIGNDLLCLAKGYPARNLKQTLEVVFQDVSEHLEIDEVSGM